MLVVDRAESPWEHLIRADPEQARAIHQAVIEVMETRRRAIRWRECPLNGSIGLSRIEVSVDVAAHASSGLLEVREASRSRVLDGVSLAPDVLNCIERQLAGHDQVRLDGGLVDYAGPVDFTFGVDFGESPSSPQLP